MGNYLTFSSPSSFTLRTNNYSKNWDGTLEYSTDASAWNTWSGGSTITADGGKLYLRGTGNTKITEGSNKSRWVLSGSNIACEGNIENLLDYATVANGEHPAMGESCFAYLFYQCYAIISTPSLPATTLTYCCYCQMFRETSIESAPVLPATTLAEYCYAQMFYSCTKLVNAPALPATTLANMCYQNMFFGCTKLTSIPALPAPLLKTWCYYGMFEGCSSVKFSNTQTEEYKYEYKIPSSGTGSGSGTQRMFISTGGTFTNDPSINTTYYTANEVIYYEPEPEEPTTTIITYNGSTIATLEAGQTATIKTAETEVEHDIIITPVFPIEIVYGDIIATADEGQTATIKCANTELEHDIVVSAKAEEDELSGTTWLFNNTVNSPSQDIYVYSDASSSTTPLLHTYKGDAYPRRNTDAVDGYWCLRVVGNGTVFVQVKYDNNIDQLSISNLANTEIIFYSGVKVTDGFIDWLKANATKQ